MTIIKAPDHEFRGVVFDLDGTLLDTLADIADAVNRVLKIRNFPTYLAESYRYFIGDGAKCLIRRSLPESNRSEKVVNECLNDFLADYGENWNIKSVPYKDIDRLLDLLVLRELPLAVLSNKPQQFTNLCVADLLAPWKFDVVIGQSDRIPPKPAPTGALEVAGRLGFPACNLLFLGDSDTDMQTARAVGMYPVGALWGFRPGSELLEGGAMALVENPLELLDIMVQ